MIDRLENGRVEIFHILVRRYDRKFDQFSDVHTLRKKKLRGSGGVIMTLEGINGVTELTQTVHAHYCFLRRIDRSASWW